jgi:hypothetical protein
MENLKTKYHNGGVCLQEDNIKMIRRFVDGDFTKLAQDWVQSQAYANHGNEPSEPKRSGRSFIS